MIGTSPFSKDFLCGAAYHDQKFLGRQSIRSPLEHFRHCRELLLQVQREDLENQFLNLSRYPFGQSYQPSIAALALLAKILGKTHPPVAPMLLPNGAPLAMKEEVRRDDCLLPLPIAAQLAEIWNELGYLEEDKEIIEKAHLVKRWVEKFPDKAKLLFYREDSFDAKEVENLSLTKVSSAVDLDLGMAASSSACLSLSGWNSALGAMQIGDVAIPSFGPQTAPLSDASRFGISQARPWGSVAITDKEGVELEGWTRCHGHKESWLHLKAKIRDHAVQFDTRFVASDTDSPLYMVFYTQAEKCSLKNSGESFFPGSLQRYKGKSDAVLLNDQVILECSGSEPELQIIPLAGEGCFWNAKFLIAFSCPSNALTSFSFRL